MYCIPIIFDKVWVILLVREYCGFNLEELASYRNLNFFEAEINNIISIVRCKEL